MSDKAYSTFARLVDPPDLAAAMRQTETFRYWHELHDLRSRLQMPDASEMFQVHVLRKMQAKVDQELQQLLGDLTVVGPDRGERVPVIRVNTTLDRYCQVDAFLEIQTRDFVHLNFDGEHARIIAITLDGSFVVISKTARVVAEIEGERHSVTAQFEAEIDLRQQYWADHLHRFWVTFDQEDSPSANIDEESLRQIAELLGSRPGYVGTLVWESSR